MKRQGFWLIGLAVVGLLFTAPSPPALATEAKTTTLVIGFTISQTGKFNVEAMRQVNGFTLWVEQVNAAGGVKLADGTVVKFASKSYDDESKEERVQELYPVLINEDKADFLISPYSSGLADVAAAIAHKHRKLMITAGAASDVTYKKGYTLIYQTYSPASRYLTGALDLLGRLDPKARKVAILHEKDLFSTEVVNALQVYAESKGYQIILLEGYDSGLRDFAPLIAKIPPGVEAVMGGGHFADSQALARQVYEKNVKAKMVALLVAPPEPRFSDLGEAAVGVIGPSQWEPLAKYSPEAAQAAGLEWYGPSIRDFVRAYKAKYKKEPSYHSAGGYVAGLLLQKAIQTAGSTDTAKIQAALDKMDLLTFYGRVKFDQDPKSHGLQIGHEMIYTQWQKDAQGKLVSLLLNQIVWPEAAKTAEAMLYPLH
ncbi:MAG: branched-chain amino acid ABC transporter substrate-binding protein [Deltaproteobacteria bacterium]|nr:branched-chain amino acid ABC transporter substrate-binding protein [Deltaproteobacteria bacterium]